MFVIAKGSFQPSHPSSTQHRALPATPAEGQNRSYLPAAGDFPDVHPHVFSTSLHGAQLVASCVEMHHFCGMSFGEDALGDVKGGWQVWGEPAGRPSPGEAQQSRGMRVAGKDWSSTLPYQSAGQKRQCHGVGGIWPWPPWAEKARFACQGKPSSSPLAGSAQLEGHGLSPQAI